MGRRSARHIFAACRWAASGIRSNVHWPNITANCANQSVASNLLRAAMEVENPLQLVGVVNAYYALLAHRAGFKAFDLSGAGVANASN